MTPLIYHHYSSGLYRVLATCALLILTACDASNAPSAPDTVLGDPVLQIADLSNDALVAPTVPDLNIEYHNQKLAFSWQAQTGVSSVSLFAFNTKTQSETLINDQVSVYASHYEMSLDTSQTMISQWLYRIELCTLDDCVSSYRTQVSTPLASAQLSLASEVSNAKWQPYLNKAGNVMVAVSIDAKVAEVHFKLNSGWVYASSITPAGMSSSEDSLVDVAMSESGDTVAVAVHQPQSNQIDISIFDRLGEGWFETSQWQTSYLRGAHKTPNNLIAVANDAASLLVLSENGVARYSREGFNYTLESIETGDTPVLAWDASPNLNALAWLSRTSNNSLELHQLKLTNNSYQHLIISNGLPLMLANGANIQINTQGDAILLAGWQLEGNQQYAAALWHAIIENDTVNVVSTQSEAIIGEPSDHLILGSSDSLETSFLSWTNNLQTQVQLYTKNKQVLTPMLALHEIALLDQAYEIALSGDGTRLSWANTKVDTLSIIWAAP